MEEVIETPVRGRVFGAVPPVVAARSLVKVFGSVRAVDGVDLEARPGELLALLGPSGCGKTTTLRLLAGFERPDQGSIALAGDVVAGDGRFVPPERRRIGVVFQDFALFPHLTVAQNLGYGVRDKSSRRRRVAEMLELIGLADAADRLPHELSGGQQQRVALGRALAPEPSLVLLDEPFSNLDAALRVRMRAEVREILLLAGATAVFVTHDQEEALSLADRVAVMQGGRLLQVDAPAELYARPVDAFVATFVGDADLLPGEADGQEVDTAIGRISAPGSPAGPVDVVLRPERVRVWLDGTGIGVVHRIEYFGHGQLVEVELPAGRRARARLGPSRDLLVGDRVSLAMTGDVLVFPAGPSVSAAAGE
ncbi:MAG: ABC transporter ATP-binding protein [Actinobacteria bacterium]|nr:ABC transporter ATP-binding protein [Actinomycetota bacterium]